MEHTLVLLKPDATRRGLRGEIIKRIEAHGYAIVEMRQFNPLTEKGVSELIYYHYAEIGQLGIRVDDETLQEVIHYMESGPIVAMIVEGPNAIAGIRKLAGATQPSEALPGTIRGDLCPAMDYEYSHIRVPNKALPNLVHASANATDARRECALWFGVEPPFGSYRMAGVEYLI